MATVRERLSQRIRFLRKEKNLTQEELGAISGLSYKFVGEIERAEVSPSLDSLEKLAKALDVPLSALLAFPQRRAAQTKEDLFRELSKAEMDTIKKAIDILAKVFR